MGIRYKLILPLVITLLVIFSMIHFFLKPSWLMQEYKEDMELHNDMLDTLSTNLINNLLAGDYSLMHDLLDSELKSKTEYWKAIVVQLEDGSQIYPLETVTQHTNNEYIDEITHNLAHNGEPLGTVTLYADRSHEVLQINERITQIEIMFLVCFSFLLIFALTIQSMLIRSPLEKLKNAASALTLGDYDIESAASWQRRNR